MFCEIYIIFVSLSTYLQTGHFPQGQLVGQLEDFWGGRRGEARQELLEWLSFESPRTQTS